MAIKPARRRRPGTMPTTVSSLAARVVEDDEALAKAIDQIIQGDARAAELAVEIMVVQARLKKLIGRQAWTLYMRLEELAAQRSSELTLAISRWAFREGQRRGRKR